MGNTIVGAWIQIPTRRSASYFILLAVEYKYQLEDLLHTLSYAKGQYKKS